MLEDADEDSLALPDSFESNDVVSIPVFVVEIEASEAGFVDDVVSIDEDVSIDEPSSPSSAMQAGGPAAASRAKIDDTKGE